jgi:hypothetical protein
MHLYLGRQPNNHLEMLSKRTGTTSPYTGWWLAKIEAKLKLFSEKTFAVHWFLNFLKLQSNRSIAMMNIFTNNTSAHLLLHLLHSTKCGTLSNRIRVHQTAHVAAGVLPRHCRDATLLEKNASSSYCLTVQIGTVLPVVQITQKTESTT